MELTKEQYFKIKALFNAVFTDKINKVMLQNVFYNRKKNHFVATDGHVLRILELPDLPAIGFSFQLKKSQFFLSESQYKALHGMYLIKIEIDRTLETSINYVDYLKIISIKSPVKVNQIALNPDAIIRFKKTFCEKVVILLLEFTGPYRSIRVYINDGEKKLVGIIMPNKIL